MSIYDIWLSKITMYPQEKLELIKKYNNSQEIYINIINGKLILPREKNDKALSIFNKEKLTDELDYMTRNNIKIVSFNNENYPVSLKNYEYAPALLYYKGDIGILNNKVCISMVGARNNTPYGEKVAKKIAKDVGNNDVCIVSGFARGIDSLSHKAVLESGGYTCGVFGCGVDVIYPSENKRLYSEIVNHGVIISEYPCKSKPYAFHFLERNRLISALSKLIVIVEAGEHSGAMNTATWAADQNIQVMAVPGDITSPTSQGTNTLIKEGSEIFLKMEDIYSILHMEKVKSREFKTQLSGKYRKIYEVLSNTPLHINEIINRTNIDITCLYELLFEMQTMNIVNCIDGSFYVRAE